MSAIDARLRLAQGLIDHETELLRTAQYRSWLDLFTPDGLYWLPVSPAQTDPLSAPSHVCEARPALDARVERLYDQRLLPQMPASRVSRLLGRPRLVSALDTRIEVAVAFHVAEARALSGGDDAIRLFAGESTYCLVPDEAAPTRLRIQSKRVDLINSESAFFGVSILL